VAQADDQMVSRSGGEVSDRLALRALVDEYASAVDARDADRFAGVFTPGGVLAIIEPGDAEPSLTYTGHAELRTVMNLLRGFATTFHLMANHTCRIDGDGATGETYCLAHHLTEDDGGAAGGWRDTLMVIRYRDRYVRSAGGWRIERRDVLRQWTEYHAAERARLAP
jgi:SnoaL-like protein